MERAGRFLRDEWTRRGDILSINKGKYIYIYIEGEIEIERKWVLGDLKSSDDDVAVIIFAEGSIRGVPGYIKKPTCRIWIQNTTRL